MELDIKNLQSIKQLNDYYGVELFKVEIDGRILRVFNTILKKMMYGNVDLASISDIKFWHDIDIEKEINIKLSYDLQAEIDANKIIYDDIYNTYNISNKLDALDSYDECERQ